MEEKKNTRLLPTIKKIMRHHAEKLYRLSKWIETELGCKPGSYKWGLSDYMQRTAVDIRIRHNNDYVECGPGYDDPEGKLFNVITRAVFQAKFHPDQLVEITRKLDKLHDDNGTMDDVKMDTKALEGVCLVNFFDYERKLKADWFAVNKKEPVLKITLEFDIYHTA